MNVKKYHLSDAPVELIDRLARNYFFSSSGFANLWTTMGGRPVYWICEKSGTPLAILSGVEFGRGFLRRFQSMPNGCYAKFLSENSSEPEIKTSAAAILSGILKEEYCKISIIDYYNLLDNTGGLVISPCSTQLVDISRADWEPPDQKLRQQIHKAERENLTIVQFDKSKHMNSLLQLVKLHEQRRSQKSRYTPKFFEALADLSSQDERIKWIWCEKDNAPVSSHIFIREGNAILHWQMYYDESRSHLQATKLIPFRAARIAQAAGVKYMNLGASPPDAEGAEFYKSKWGGKIYNYNCYVRKNLLGKLL